MGSKPLTDAQRQEVKRLCAQGLSAKAIMKSTGLSEASVYRIRKEWQNDMGSISIEEAIGQTSPVDMEPSFEMGSLESLVDKQRENGVLPESHKREGEAGRGTGYWLTASQKREAKRSAAAMEDMIAQYKAQNAKPGAPEQNAAKAEQPQEKPPENAPEAERISVERKIITISYTSGEIYVQYNSDAGDLEIGLLGNAGYFELDTADAPAKLRIIAAHLSAIADAMK